MEITFSNVEMEVHYSNTTTSASFMLLKCGKVYLGSSAFTALTSLACNTQNKHLISSLAEVIFVQFVVSHHVRTVCF